MAKITVDASTCVGCGLCEQSCPEVFKIQDDNIAHVIGNQCKNCDIKEVAQQCPVEAIKIE